MPASSRRRYLALQGTLLIAGMVIVLLFAASALAGPTVTVRVEGESATLLPATKVTLNAPEPVSGCPADSVAAAVNLAVDGNWDHGEANSGGGDFTETILGETHEFTNNSDTWAEWVNYKWGGGICSDLLSEGDEVLMVADHEPPPYAPTVLPLVVSEAPASVQAGSSFTVKVSAVHTPPEVFAEAGEGTPVPTEGVTVSGGGARVTTGAGGAATLTLSSVGEFTLRATKAGDASSLPFTICVHNGDDGTCGTSLASSPTGAASSGAAGQGTLVAPYKGSYALVASMHGLLDGHVYGHRAAPRVLAGSILSHTTVSSVELELRRDYKGRCYAYEGVRERFLGARCGEGSFFKVSTTGSFSYLLPSALPPGRYVLDIKASDAVGNTTTLARGTSRIVFYVR